MNSLKDRIQAGRDGKYKGLDNGLGDINKYIYGVQQASYTLVGSLSGGGKTTLVDFILLNALADAKKQGKKVTIFYYSFEINKDIKKLNWLSVHIYNKYKVVISPQSIGGLGDEILTNEQQKLVDAEIDYIEDLFNTIHFRYESLNATGIYKELMHYAALNGKFIKEKYTVVHEGQQEEKDRIIGYEANNPEEYVLVALDHQALISGERNFTLKENIDKLSQYFIWLRNICKYSFYVVSQFNQSLNSVDRQKFKGVDISPQQNDYKDSGNPYQDCDIALGLMNPWKMDFKSYLGYDLSTLKDRFRLIKVVKNRFGRDNVAFGYGFSPQAGQFKCLPEPEMIEMSGGYQQYLV